MAKTLAVNISLIASDSDLTDTTIAQLGYASGDASYTTVVTSGPVSIEANPASPVSLFPAIMNMAAGKRITATFKVTYHADDNTNALRLMTWVADGAQVETVVPYGSFSFDTSLTLDRAGSQPCTIELFYQVT